LQWRLIAVKRYSTADMKIKKIRIVIADDHQLIRETWRLLLEQEEQFVIVAECTDGAHAIEAVTEHQPDIVLMDINMYPVNGFEATRKICAKMPGIKIIGMSINDQPAYAKNMLQLGAKGYITKNSSKEEMMTAIDEVMKGRQYICKEIKHKMNPGTS
jgi:two-component system invasion response regulator UvrY